MRHEIPVLVSRDTCDACATRDEAVEAVELNYMVLTGPGGKLDLCGNCLGTYQAIEQVITNGAKRLPDHLIAPLVTLPLVIASIEQEPKALEPGEPDAPASEPDPVPPKPSTVAIGKKKPAEITPPPPVAPAPEPVAISEPAPAPEEVIAPGPIEQIRCSCTELVEVYKKAMHAHAMLRHKKKITSIVWLAFSDGEWAQLGARMDELPESDVARPSRRTPAPVEAAEAAAQVPAQIGVPRVRDAWRDDPFAVQCPDAPCNGVKLLAASVDNHVRNFHAPLTANDIAWIFLHSEEDRAMWKCGESTCGDDVPHMLKAAHAKMAHNGKRPEAITWRRSAPVVFTSEAEPASPPNSAAKADPSPSALMETPQEWLLKIRLRCGHPDCADWTGTLGSSSRSQHAKKHGRAMADVPFLVADTGEVFLGAEAYVEDKLKALGISGDVRKDRSATANATVLCLVRNCKDPEVPWSKMLKHAKDVHKVLTRIGLNFAVGNHWRAPEECATCISYFPTVSEYLLHVRYYEKTGYRHAPDSVSHVLPADRFDANGVLKELVSA